MKRGDLFLVYKGSKIDPREFRVFVVVGRQTVIDSNFSTITCAPIYSRWDELSTQVPLGIESGLKHDSSIHCDELISIPKSMLTNFIGTLSDHLLMELNKSLIIALDIED